MASERILVVPRSVLAEKVAVEWGEKYTESIGPVAKIRSKKAPCKFGGRKVTEAALEAAAAAFRFVDRDSAENDPSLKQIIPYMIVRTDSAILLLKRLRKQSEQRLWDKYSIGIGGHLNPADGETDFMDILECGMDRELNEELEIFFSFEPEIVGCINDDDTDVGSVHFGIVYQIHLEGIIVGIREKTKMSGEFADLKRLAEVRDNMESWSQIVFDHFLAPRRRGR
ncbi:MAG: phosphoesterase [Candidatus Coatesbacteria bacterium]|nr:phosphoesterase [Candidatus Coatesbacteria bacterium]